MASRVAVWALDQTVNAPHSAINNPLEEAWHICQGPPRVLQNSSPSEEREKGGGASKVLIEAFNMLISPGAPASVMAKLNTSKGNCYFFFQSGDVLLNPLKQKTFESWHQVDLAMGTSLANEKRAKAIARKVPYS